MNEILKQVKKQIEEISGGLYYCFPFPSRRTPYLDIYDKSTVGWEWICRVEPLRETDEYHIISYDSCRSLKKVGKDILLMEVLKELWRHE